jgi:phage-related protein
MRGGSDWQPKGRCRDTAAPGAGPSREENASLDREASLAIHIQTDILRRKPLRWLGDSLNVVRGFSPVARHRVGTELRFVQEGEMPSDWKPMPSIGAGVNEIRAHVGNEYRVLYVGKFAEAVYVLHAFVKKTRRTSKPDVALAAKRYRELVTERRG